MTLLDCSHHPSNIIELHCGRAGVMWCRGCSEWVLSVHPDPMVGGDGERWNGAGFDDYQEAVAELARLYPAFDGVTFLYSLGGHAAEVVA